MSEERLRSCECSPTYFCEAHQDGESPTPNGEKMAKEVWDEYCLRGQDQPIQKLIAAAIDKAYAEAEDAAREAQFHHDFEENGIVCKEYVKEAYAKGREEALTGLSFKEDVEWHAAMKQGYDKGREEGWADAINRLDDIQAEGIWLGFTEAVEKAAKIAESTWADIPQEIWDEGFEPSWMHTLEIATENIRALRPTVSGEAKPICTAVECYCGKHFKAEEK